MLNIQPCMSGGQTNLASSNDHNGCSTWVAMPAAQPQVRFAALQIRFKWGSNVKALQGVKLLNSSIKRRAHREFPLQKLGLFLAQPVVNALHLKHQKHRTSNIAPFDIHAVTSSKGRTASHPCSYPAEAGTRQSLAQEP